MLVAVVALVVTSLSQRRVLAARVVAGRVEALEHLGLAWLALLIPVAVVVQVRTTQAMFGRPVVLVVQAW